QHVGDGAPDALDALVTPGPDGRAYEVEGRHAGRPELFFQTQVEVGGIDPDEDIRWLGLPATGDIAVNPQQTRQALEGVDIAEHGQRMHGMPHIETGLLHGGPPDAFAAHARQPLLQTLNDPAGQQVARRLSGDQPDADRHQRTMPRPGRSMKDASTSMASLA